MKIRRKQRETRAHALRWGLIIAVTALCIIGYGGIKGTLNVIDEWGRDLPDVTDPTHFEYSEKTRVYANDHETLLAEFYLQNQEPVTIDQVNDYVLRGTVATEDERFYEHDGVDLYGIARALVNNLMGGALEGASTITQQLVRGTILTEEATDISLERKVREAELALKMEEVYTKDEILMMYLNTINYGQGCYGIQAAAQHYFQKDAANLSIVEAATLIGIPQSPTNNNPVDHPEACVARRNLVLDRMLSNGVITADEHQAAQATDLVLNIKEDSASEGIYLYPYFTSMVREQLLDELSYESVFSGGLTVYTTIDPELQGYAEEAAAITYEQIASSGDTDVQLGMACVDPSNGHIVAMIGGRDYDSNKWNLASNEQGRQTGSSFKAFTIATAIEQGISPQTLVDCTPGARYSDGNIVNNYDNANYGVRSLESATWVSSNTGFVRLVTEENGVSPSSLANMASRLGIKNPPAIEAATLGAVNSTPLDMASAYGAFANDGMYYEDICITQVIDKDGNAVIDNTNPEGEQVISPEVAYATTRVLRGVIEQPSGTATDARLNGHVAAGKTGTSEKWHDLWFCGYTPQLSTAVWTGADPQRQMWEAPWSKTMWREFMNRALADMPAEDFTSHPDPAYDSKYTAANNQKYAQKEANSETKDEEGETSDENAKEDDEPESGTKPEGGENAKPDEGGNQGGQGGNGGDKPEGGTQPEGGVKPER